MTHFWKWLAVSGVVAGLIYTALTVLSGFAIPWRSPHFDTAVATTTQRGWVNEARYFVLNKNVFSEPEDRIVILGASNARDPFRPEIMERSLPDWRVANASLSGASIDEIADAVDLIYLEQGADPGNRTAFVICLNYIQFIPPSRPEGTDSPLASEALRGGVHERTEGRLTSRYPRPVERLVSAVFRPQAVAASLPRRTFKALFANPELPAVKNFVDRFRGDDPLARWVEVIGEHPDLDAVTVPDDVRRALMDQRLAGAGGDKALSEAGFRELAELVALIRSRGDSVVLVDLPLPDWHLAGVPVTDASYRSGVAEILSRWEGDPAVAALSLREFDDPDNFFDSGHTKPRLWPVLSRRLAGMIAASSVLSPRTARTEGPSRSDR